MRTLFTLLLLSSLAAVSSAGQTNVLFIGNSFTYYNDMPGLFRGLANAAGIPVHVEGFTGAGLFVKDHLQNPQLFAKLHERPWDYVVVQDNQGYFVGSMPESNVDQTVIADNHRLLDSIRASNGCARVVWFGGWAFKGGMPSRWPGDNSIRMIQRVLAHMHYLNELSWSREIIAPIGAAWITSLTYRPDIDPFGPDGAHPSPAGSFLGASVCFATILRADPTAVNYNGALSAEDARELRSFAYGAVVDSLGRYGLMRFTPTLALAGTSISTDTTFSVYRWYRDGVLVDSAVGSSLAIAKDCASYGVEVTDSAGCVRRSFRLPPYDAAVALRALKDDVACDGTLHTTGRLSNHGIAPIETAQIDALIDGVPAGRTTLADTIATFSAAAFDLTVDAGAEGLHALTAAYVPPGTADCYFANDSASIRYTSVTTSRALPLVEGFEGTAFPPGGWILRNPDRGITWERTTAAHAGEGVASAFMNNKNYTSNGEVDELLSPPVEIPQGAKELSFDLAYCLLTDPNAQQTWSDTLEVLITTDCGDTWLSLYRKAGVPLTTVDPPFTDQNFVPQSGDWRHEVATIPAGITGSAIVKFRHATDYENNLFIDNIAVTSVTSGIPIDMREGALSVDVRSTGTRAIQVELMESLEHSATVAVYDAAGARIISARVDKGRTLMLPIDNAGWYLVQVASGSQSRTEAVVVF